MKTHKFDYKTGYPMNFQHKVNGSEITIDLCNKDNIQIGDKLDLVHVPNFNVTQILVKREPAIKSQKNPNNVNHHAPDIMFYTLQGTLTDD